MQRAEVFRSGAWHAVNGDDVLAIDKPVLRCSGCHGQVIAVRSYLHGGKPRFSHRQAFAQCNPYDEGLSPLHPDAIE
jgi:hypothetical protein